MLTLILVHLAPVLAALVPIPQLVFLALMGPTYLVALV